MEPVELSDDRLLLRLPTLGDVDDITRACQDAELQRWIPVPVPYAKEHALAWVEDTPRCWANEDGAALGGHRPPATGSCSAPWGCTPATRPCARSASGPLPGPAGRA